MFKKLKDRIFECEQRIRETEREVNAAHDGIRSVWKHLLNSNYGLHSQTLKSNADILLDCLYECNEHFSSAGVGVPVWINGVKTAITVYKTTGVFDLYAIIKKSCGCGSLKITGYNYDNGNLYIDVLQM